MYPKILPNRDAESGFTLIELCVVIAIIGILAAALIPSYVDHVRQAKIAATVKDGICLQSALLNFATKYPEAPAPPDMSTYAELSAFGRQNGCYLAAETDAIYRPRPWIFPSPIRCYVVIWGRLYRVPCPPWPRFPWTPGPILPPVPVLGPGTFQAHGAELVLTVPGVPADMRGAAVLVSPDRGVVKLTLAEAARDDAETQAAPPAGP